MYSALALNQIIPAHMKFSFPSRGREGNREFFVILRLTRMKNENFKKTQ